MKKLQVIGSNHKHTSSHELDYSSLKWV